MENKFDLDLALIPKELKILLEINRHEKQIEQLQTKKSLINIDWNFFIELAIHHRIYPLLYSKLKRYQLI